VGSRTVGYTGKAGNINALSDAARLLTFYRRERPQGDVARDYATYRNLEINRYWRNVAIMVGDGPILASVYEAQSNDAIDLSPVKLTPD
jgi:hypothetical protein